MTALVYPMTHIVDPMTHIVDPTRHLLDPMQGFSKLTSKIKFGNYKYIFFLILTGKVCRHLGDIVIHHSCTLSGAAGI